jgi:hypothetical protein
MQPSRRRHQFDRGADTSLPRDGSQPCTGQRAFETVPQVLCCRNSNVSNTSFRKHGQADVHICGTVSPPLSVKLSADQIYLHITQTEPFP